ncbi:MULTISPECIES: AMP-binding protein [Rhodopseudomonas]|uniref:3-methylmercaptopropionyl-CoA ligase n=1 Tax=Rhodopseudomonas palustris TaxID=1076 RepID=A0A0D7F4G7_RHOPL|nr:MULTISPECIES: AMP-binding protein [Rhodopseudomonas]KIZ47978.1 acyl-CoA synthetase [Rhodopseudomonas palustris]MDF3808772.1 AMP-binding protein [Rhodopseudomonas sp. BAL398]WOK19191.1 AMP-binding protein [Rhodopseudomonas sp. BAL398]
MNAYHSGGTGGSLIVNAVARFGDRPALADGRLRWSYRQFGVAVGRFITLFRGIGLNKGDAVSILSGNRAESWAAISAAMVMGLRYTPLHPMAAEDDHAFIIEDAEIDALIVESGKFAARGLAIRGRVPGLKHLLSFGAVDGARDLLDGFDKVEAAPLVDESSTSEIAWLAYTGGTTGRSKGVMIPHRALTTMAVLLYSDWDWPAEIRFIAATPISHAAGVTVYPVMMRGGFVRLVQGFEAEAYCAVVAEEKITAAFLVPTLIYALIDAPQIRARYDLSSLDMIVYGAAPMSPDRLREGMAIFGKIFVQLYGQTEAPQVITSMRKVDHNDSKPGRLGSCGRPNPLVDVKLFDSEMREVGIGEPGEICVRGTLVMDGYWKRPEATAEAFRGGWLHTGDVAVKDDEGYLYIVDRTKDMIISGGFNIYPREVEDALMAHHAVASAAVIGVPDDKWGEAVKAFVVLKAGANNDAAELQAHVKHKRGAPWSPKTIDFVEAIPVTGLGKIDRKVLRAPYWENRTRGVA